MTYIKKKAKSDMVDDTLYHIYAKDKRLYNCLSKKEFIEKWDMLNKMVGLMKTDYVQEDLSFELVSSSGGFSKNKDHREPEGGDSY